jgi:radical SAM superfamily enzyme YgiQ (UPF0313 family)
VVFGGEIPVRQLASLCDNGDLHHVPGVIYVDDGEIRTTDPAPPVSAHSAPAPLFASAALDSCFLPETVLPVVAGYSACPYGRCAFCSTNHSYLGRNNFKSAQHIFEELDELHTKYRCSHFTFNDDCLPLDTAIGLSRLLITGKRRYCFFGAIRSSESLSREDLELLKEAGFLRLQFGFESAADRMLARFQKGRSHADMLRTLHFCRSVGISVLLSAFVGFPGETESEASATIDFFNNHNHLFDAASVVPYSFEDGSPAWLQPERYGISPIDGSTQDLFHDRQYRANGGIGRSGVERLLAERLIPSRYEPVLGTAPSLLYLSKYGYSRFMEMILTARECGTPLHPTWQRT